MDVIRYLNDNSGAVIAIATTAYVLITLLLVLEARSSRRSARAASVEFSPVPLAPLYLKLILENPGPGIAHDVVAKRWLQQPDGTRIPERRHAQPTLAVGQHKTFLVNDEKGGAGVSTLASLAEAGFALVCEWSWTDSAQGRLAFRPRRRRKVYDLAKLKDDFYGGWSLIEADSIETIPKVHEELQKVTKAIERVAVVLEAPAREEAYRQWREARDAEQASPDETAPVAEPSGPAAAENGPDTPSPGAETGAA